MNKHSVASGLGLSSLLVVFVSLCMILLSVLSLTNANSNMKTAKNYQKSVNDYYNACFEADKIYYDLVSLIDNNDQNELKKYLKNIIQGVKCYVSSSGAEKSGQRSYAGQLAAHFIYGGTDYDSGGLPERNQQQQRHL